MNTQIIKRLRKITAYTITGLVFILLSSFLLLQAPPVQQSLVNRFLGDLTQITGFRTSIKNFRMLWFDRLELEDVLITDVEDNRMIAVKRLRINFKFTEVLRGKYVNIDGISAKEAQVYLKYVAENDSSEDLNINVFIDRINNHYAASGTGSGSNPVINIGEAVLESSRFVYDDGSADTLSGFDYHHFTLNIDEANLEKFVMVGDTIEFNVESMLANDEKTGLDVKEMTTFFRVSQKGLEFYDLHLKAGKSSFSDSLAFHFDSQRDLSNFNTLVSIHSHIESANIHPHDLALFAPEARALRYPLRLSGDFRGRVNKFRFTDMIVDYGNSRFQGKLNMDGLPDLNETFIEANLVNSTLHFHDLSFALNDATVKRLEPLGTTRLNGEFLGYISDFVARGTFRTPLGVVESDINLKINEQNAERSTYSGNLSLQQFNLGSYLKDTTNFQFVNLRGTIHGSGLTLRTADFQLNGTISSLGIRGYTYQNITTNARFASEFFRGRVAIDDSNLKANLQGSIDLRNNVNKIQVLGKIDTANIDRLHLINDNLVISAAINVNSSGFSLDSLQGIGELRNLNVQYKDKFMHLNSIMVNAKKEKQARELRMSSDLAEASATGNFYFSDMFRDLQRLLSELKLNIGNDPVRIAEYYRGPLPITKDYAVDFTVKMKDLKPLTNLLSLDLEVSPNVLLEGNFTSGITTMLTAYSSIPTLRYENFAFHNTHLDINTSKLKDSTEVLAMVFVRSDKQEIQGVATENLVTEVIWDRDHVAFSLDIDQEKMKNNVRLRGTVDFHDSTYIRLKNSTFQLISKNWTVDNGALISQKGNEWHLQHVGFSQGEQQVLADGKISEDATLPLTIWLRNIELNEFESLTTEKFSGLVNAELTFRNFYQSATFENLVDIDNLIVNNFLVGNIDGKNKWSNVEKKFLLDFTVTRKELNAIVVTGDYDPANTVTPLNVKAKLNQASLRLAEPVLRGLFSQIDGTITGDFVIRGTPSKPLVRGAGQVENGQMMVDYLKTLYRFNGTIGLTPTSLYFEKVTVTDSYNNKGRLEGIIAHRNFDNMRLNIDANFNNLMVLNTTSKDNSLFYGQGFATGQVNFFGPISNMKISATGRTEKNTRMYIPLSGTGTVEKKEFISFVNFKDTTRQQTTDNRKKLTGLTIDLNLDITEDAYCEIIFDIKAGDIIRGRGNGDIRLQLDTKGEFNMFGGITFEEGGYNFTLYNLINKEFEIQKGSEITWSGDPYQGQMKINAAYNQLASVAPVILESEAQSDPVLRRKYPLQVILTLEGAMLSPQINFDIVAKDLPQSVTLTNGTSKRLAFEFAAFKTKLDEQELKKQVFSLIILRRLSPLNETISTSGSVTNSVSELLSNQLSYWMSQVDENLEIDVDLGALDAEAFNTFQLRLSYTFLNGRLRVTRDGTFTNQNTNTTNTNNSTATLVGDWTVDYLLTPDGKFKVRMYNRTNANAILNTLNNQNAITTGVSVQHTQSFNKLSDLWQSARKQREQQKPVPDANEEAILNEEDGGNE